MPARVHTEIPADQFRLLSMLLDHESPIWSNAALAARAIHHLAKYAPAGKRITLSIEWATELDETRGGRR